LANRSKSGYNRQILGQIAADEEQHAAFWKTITKQDVKPNQKNIFKYTLLVGLFGLTFGIKPMENGEKKRRWIMWRLPTTSREPTPS
jgi:hypothetical protein